MNEDFKKKLKILAIIFGVILVIMLLIFLFLYLKKPNTEDVQLTNKNDNTAVKVPQSTSITKTETIKNTKIISKPIVSETKTAADVAELAASFAERFGTYSNQSDFSNMVDLQLYMSEKMRAWSETYVADLKKAKNDVYYGITTKSATTDVKSFNDNAGTATVVVKTRRREATNSIANVSDTYNQDISVELVKVGTDWKVDGVFWEKVK